MAAIQSRTNMALAIPPDKQYDVANNIYEDSAILQLADVRRMTSAVQDVITSGSWTFGSGANAPAPVAEAGYKPVADAALGSYQLVAQKMAVFVIVSEELLAESAVDLISYYQEGITQQFSKYIDVFALTGGGPFGTENLIAAATANGVGPHNQILTGTTAAPTGVLDKVTAAFNSVEADDFQPNGWLMGRPFKGFLRALNDSTGRPLLAESFQGDVPDTMWGENVYYLGRGVFPTGNNATRAVVGDFSQYVIGIRDDLTFSLHNEGTISLDITDATTRANTQVNLLQQNLVALRAEMRLGAKIINNAAFAKVVNPAA
jgi:HK97 family phage major capsid protein